MTAPATSRMPWGQLTRLGLVQAAIGSAVVLLTTTINRVIVVELGLPASVPGLLVALHFGVQLVLRPRMGHASDRMARRTPWIVAGLATCAVAGVALAASLPVMRTQPVLGISLAAIASVVLGAGVSAAGTPLLALMSERAGPSQRAGAAAITWILMIVGIIITAATSGALLSPFSFARLLQVATGIGAVGVCIALVATRGMERAPHAQTAATTATRHMAASFRSGFAQVWQEPAARAFTSFVFFAMLAYSAQDLILEPFAGVAFGMSPAASTTLSSTHHGGVLIGMVLAALLATRAGQLRHWAAGGCLASALAYALLVMTPAIGDIRLFRMVVPVLGMANGVFAIGAIGSMMALTGDRHDGRAGLRLGVFGAAQAMAYAVGTLAGAAGVDVARTLLRSPVRGYLAVFTVEALLFAGAAVLALRSAARDRAGAMLQHRGDLLPAVLHS